MQKAQRLTPAERSLAIQRLRTTTMGVTLASLGATLGFGWVAALSNPGSQAVASSVSTAAPSAGGASSLSSSSSSSSDTTTDTTNGSGLQSSGSVGSSASASGQATSGGS